jgi:hypothetical protein
MNAFQVTLEEFPSNKPHDSEDSHTYLLLFGNWQWVIARWGAERGQFFTEGGDYIEESKPFRYAKLPERI